MKFSIPSRTGGINSQFESGTFFYRYTLHFKNFKLCFGKVAGKVAM